MNAWIVTNFINKFYPKKQRIDELEKKLTEKLHLVINKVNNHEDQTKL